MGLWDAIKGFFSGLVRMFLGVVLKRISDWAYGVEEPPSIRQRLRHELGEFKDRYVKTERGSRYISGDNPTYMVEYPDGTYNPRKPYQRGFTYPERNKTTYSFQYPEDPSGRFRGYGRKGPYRSKLNNLYRNNNQIYEKRRRGRYVD